MSIKNFYQTLYQTEQLFRLDNDPFVAMPPSPTPVTKPLLIDAEPAQTEPLLVTALMPETAPTGLISADEGMNDGPVLVVEPLIEPEPLPERPVLLNPAPARTMPSPPRPAVELAGAEVSGIKLPDVPARPLLNHKVLILVDEELLPSDVLFLEKILAAINLNINGVDLLNVHGLTGIDFAPILADKVIHHFLTFGVPFQRLNLDILMDRYQPVRFHGITFMMADPLAAIEGDKNLKKRLWEALKRIFLMG